MEVRNCKKCNKIFNYLSSPLCPSCRDAEDAEFAKVKDFLWQHPGATMHQVSDATGISTDKILRYLREERLMMTGDNSSMLLDCLSCGTSIKTGRYCEKCARDNENSLKREKNQMSSSINTGYSKERGRMHVTNRIKSRGRNS